MVHSHWKLEQIKQYVLIRQRDRSMQKNSIEFDGYIRMFIYNNGLEYSDLSWNVGRAVTTYHAICYF